MSQKPGSERPQDEPAHTDPASSGQVQCPNCCRLAPVTNRSMGLLFYHCELCGTSGATPDPADVSD